MSDNKTILSDLETKLLYGLANSEGPLLDNEPLILVLKKLNLNLLLLQKLLLQVKKQVKLLKNKDKFSFLQPLEDLFYSLL